MAHKSKNEGRTSEKPCVTLPGIVDKVIPATEPVPGLTLPEKVQIAVEGAEPLYGEIRVDNTLHDEAGNAVRLKLGDEVDVKIEAKSEATMPHKPASPELLTQKSPIATGKKTS